jgi:hypothetical protein
LTPVRGSSSRPRRGRGEFYGKRNVEWLIDEVTDVDTLVADIGPDQLGAIHVQAAARHDDLAVDIQVRIGQIGRHQQIVAVNGRAQ